MFETIVVDLRRMIRLGEGKNEQPTAANIDSRTLQGLVENGNRGCYEGHKRRNGTKLHLADDTLGQFLDMTVTPANAGDRAQVEALTEAMPEATGDAVEVVYVDQGYTGKAAEDAAARCQRWLEAVKMPDTKRGFVLLPRRWVVERTFGWLSRFQRLAKDYERLEETVTGLHLVAFSALMLGRMTKLLLV